MSSFWQQNPSTSASVQANNLATPIPDPGNAGAISVTRSGTCSLVTAGAETRTLAIPTFLGQMIQMSMQTDGGDGVVTVAAAFNAAGNTVITFNDVGDQVLLTGARTTAGALVWRLIVNNGTTLS